MQQNKNHQNIVKYFTKENNYSAWLKQKHGEMPNRRLHPQGRLGFPFKEKSKP